MRDARTILVEACAGASLLTLGCVTTQTHIVKTPISTERVKSVGPAWEYDSAIEATTENFGAPIISLRLRRHKACTTKEILTTANSEQTVRRWRGNGGWIANGLAIASASVLGGALVSGYASDTGFTNDYQPASPSGERSGWGATNGTGKAVIFGGISTGAIGAFALVHNIWAIDSERNLGELVEERELDSSRCEEEPAQGILVTVASDAGELFSTLTDEQGQISFTDHDSLLLTSPPPYRVSVDGRDEQSIAQKFAYAHSKLVEEESKRSAQAAVVEQVKAQEEEVLQANAAPSLEGSRFSLKKGRWTHPVVTLSFKAKRRWKARTASTELMLTHDRGMVLMAVPFVGKPDEANAETKKILGRYANVQTEFERPQQQEANGVNSFVQKGTGRHDGVDIEWIWIVAIDLETQTGIVFTLVAHDRALYRYTNDFFDIMKSLRANGTN